MKAQPPTRTPHWQVDLGNPWELDGTMSGWMGRKRGEPNLGKQHASPPVPLRPAAQADRDSAVQTGLHLTALHSSRRAVSDGATWEDSLSSHKKQQDSGTGEAKLAVRDIEATLLDAAQQRHFLAGEKEKERLNVLPTRCALVGVGGSLTSSLSGSHVFGSQWGGALPVVHGSTGPR